MLLSFVTEGGEVPLYCAVSIENTPKKQKSHCDMAPHAFPKKRKIMDFIDMTPSEPAYQQSAKFSYPWRKGIACKGKKEVGKLWHTYNLPCSARDESTQTTTYTQTTTMWHTYTRDVGAKKQEDVIQTPQVPEQATPTQQLPEANHIPMSILGGTKRQTSTSGGGEHLWGALDAMYYIRKRPDVFGVFNIGTGLMKTINRKSLVEGGCIIWKRGSKEAKIDTCHGPCNITTLVYGICVEDVDILDTSLSVTNTCRTKGICIMPSHLKKGFFSQYKIPTQDKQGSSVLPIHTVPHSPVHPNVNSNNGDTRVTGEVIKNNKHSFVP